MQNKLQNPHRGSFCKDMKKILNQTFFIEK